MEGFGWEMDKWWRIRLCGMDLQGKLQGGHGRVTEDMEA